MPYKVIHDDDLPFPVMITGKDRTAVTIETIARCKECSNRDENYYCKVLDIYPSDEWFCASGERKEQKLWV